MSRINPTPSVAKLIWGKAGERCCICRNPVSRSDGDGAIYATGKIAHIYAAEKGGPRFDANKTDEELRAYENLMLVCANHHDEIDNDLVTYTVEALEKLKKDHENWVSQQLAQAIPAVTYADLEVAIKYLENQPAVSQNTDDYSLTAVKAKITKNELTNSSERLIQMGLTQAPSINAYLNQFPDPQYEERLRSLFITKYTASQESGFSGDALFYEMISFVKGDSVDMPRLGAAIALVTYFFERCDIFEK